MLDTDTTDNYFHLTAWHTCHVLLNLLLFFSMLPGTFPSTYWLGVLTTSYQCIYYLATLLLCLVSTFLFYASWDFSFHLMAWCAYHILLIHLLLSYTLTSLGVLILCLAVLTFSHSLIHKFTKQKISNLTNLVGLSTK